MAVLSLYEVPLLQTVVFFAYVGLGVTLPGMLWWRALRGGPRCLVEELAAGTALGYALEVLAYIPARALGLPLAVLAMPAGTVVAFLAVPRLRGLWAGAGVRVPLWWAWTMSGLVTFAVALSAVTFFRLHGLTWPGNAAPYVDIPWHLSMAADAKHHMPAQFPYVAGEPLLYHWFVYADMAATSWVTRIELQTLLFRFSLLPMIGAYTVLLGLVARRLIGRWWPGAVAVGTIWFAAAPRLAGWPAPPAPSGLGAGLPWLSPTQSFGMLLFAPLVLVLIDMFRRRRHGAGRWILVIVLLAALMGAKATFLPLLLAGLVLVVLVHGVTHRAVHRTGLVTAAMTACFLVCAQVFLYRGEDQGLRLAPFHLMKRLDNEQSGAASLLRLTAATPWLPVAVVTVIFLCGWGVIWAGTFGFFRRPAWLLDPAVLLLAGIGTAGLGAVVVFGHPGLSETYFLRSSAPYLSILAACGFAVAVPSWVRRGRALPAALIALGAGAATAAWVGGPLGTWARRAIPGDALGARIVLHLTPYAVLGLVVALVAGLLLALRRVRWPAGLIPLITLALVSGFGLTSLQTTALDPFGRAAEAGWRVKRLASTARADVPRGGIKAARWLRAHSSPDDLLATNVHCRWSVARQCDNRHFWISAYAERRVLVEGWGYANGVNTRAELYGSPSMAYVPFDDSGRLTDNDMAFETPSAATIGALRERYGVRWLFVDDRPADISPELGLHAALRFRSGHCAVYEIGPRGAS
ncbi:hypothetical protein J4573_34105 [Actinomadura barringtoniae]|uniref:Uncharacterized protein n=1 Tax=Actinomadura barringtoniae TaxID=1427535 RepID=A0A939PGN2_9ACTN|nr:hypothetical protein [Actinomadura barringtoniae]MBO2452165.1 hypothetical protein [Actinomadura barringtoniae]